MSVRRSKTRSVTSNGTVICIFFSVFAAFFCTVSLSLVAAWLFSCQFLSVEHSVWLGPLIVTISVFVAAFFASRRRSHRLLLGASASVLYCVAAVLFCAWILPGSFQPAAAFLSVAALMAGNLCGVTLSAVFH